MKKDIDNNSITYSSGNVFADMGLANPEERHIKVRLARLVHQAIEDRQWTQQDAAQFLGVAEATISQILRGRLKHISIEVLFYLLTTLYSKVTITVGSNVKEHQIVLPQHHLVTDSPTHPSM